MQMKLGGDHGDGHRLGRLAGRRRRLDDVRDAADRETLDAIPSSRNGTVAFMGQAPGVRPQIDIGGDTITSPPVFHAFGQDNQPWQTIDGVVVSAAKSGTQGGIYWDYGNVEEAKVGTFGSPAEVPTRGVLINGIVKSGGNDFHGTGFYAFQNHVLQGNNIDDALNAQGISAPGQLDFRTDLSGDLGGRIVRNKLWFYTERAAPRPAAGHAAVLPAERRASAIPTTSSTSTPRRCPGR